MVIPNEVGDRSPRVSRRPAEVEFGYSLRVPHTTIASSLPYAYRYSAGIAPSTSADGWSRRLGNTLVMELWHPRYRKSGVLFPFTQRFLGSGHKARNFESSAGVPVPHRLQPARRRAEVKA